MQVWSKFVHWFRRYRPETKFHTLKKVAVTLKIGSRSPKSNQFVPPSQQCICASLVKICSLVQKIKSGNEISHLKKVAVTLKMMSRSPKSNQLFTPSQHCFYASLVKICPLVQKITPGNEISYITKCRCDLEDEVKVTKIYSTLHALPTLYLCKFGQNQFTGS